MAYSPYGIFGNQQTKSGAKGGKKHFNALGFALDDSEDTSFDLFNTSGDKQHGIFFNQQQQKSVETNSPDGSAKSSSSSPYFSSQVQSSPVKTTPPASLLKTKTGSETKVCW